ncbi:unnamed protein product [Cuscuta europaea]|uniref:Uncharacterized protein n=1 Tax=Cuscuta europaea TaxID=41803 RepID=A0A9P0ZNE0_CUSEU|nr:unnamed protein product [Cuscuta europaea]
MKSGLSRPDRVQFEQMRKLMTPLQRENLFMDSDGLVQINHGGSIEEAEMWYGMNILNGKNSAEAVRNYLDCKLAPHWADYQNPRDLASIRAKDFLRITFLFMRVKRREVLNNRFTNLRFCKS